MAASMSGPRLLTYRQAADALGVSPRTVARRVKAGAVAVVVDGGIRRIPSESLEVFVASRTVPAREPGRSRRPARTSGGRTGSTAPARAGGRVVRLWEDSEANDL